MPKHLQARAAQDEREERQVRKLAGSHHAPADWKFHAQMVVESWAGKTPQETAATLSCHPRTVRIHLNRFNGEGVNGLGMREGAGRKPRLTELHCLTKIFLCRSPSPFSLQLPKTLAQGHKCADAPWRNEPSSAILMTRGRGS